MRFSVCVFTIILYICSYSPFVTALKYPPGKINISATVPKLCQIQISPRGISTQLPYRFGSHEETIAQAVVGCNTRTYKVIVTSQNDFHMVNPAAQSVKSVPYELGGGALAKGQTGQTADRAPFHGSSPNRYIEAVQKDVYWSQHYTHSQEIRIYYKIGSTGTNVTGYHHNLEFGTYKDTITITVMPE